MPPPVADVGAAELAGVSSSSMLSSRADLHGTRGGDLLGLSRHGEDVQKPPHQCHKLKLATSCCVASVGRLSDFGPLDAMPVDETEIVGSTFRFSSSGFIMDPLQAMNIEVFDFICLYKF